MREMLFDGTDMSAVLGHLAHADAVYYHGGFVIAQREGREYHVNTQTGEWTRLSLLAPVQVTVN